MIQIDSASLGYRRLTLTCQRNKMVRQKETTLHAAVVFYSKQPNSNLLCPEDRLSFWRNIYVETSLSNCKSYNIDAYSIYASMKQFLKLQNFSPYLLHQTYLVCQRLQFLISIVIGVMQSCFKIPTALQLSAKDIRMVSVDASCGETEKLIIVREGP